MDTTYFNYNEIYIRARGNPAAIVLLTFAQTSKYNIYTSKKLMRDLHINHIPKFLFSSRTLHFTPTSLVECKYKTKEPASYFNNSDFLFYGINARHKAIYLKALAARKISDKENRIPRNYFNKVSANPFLQVDDDYIYFPFEASK